MAELTPPARSHHHGKNTGKIRGLRGIKQETLAAELGVCQSELSHLEQSGKIGDAMLEKIAIALKVPVGLLKNLNEEVIFYAINNIFHTVNDHAGETRMDTITSNLTLHKGRKIERIRKLSGLSQAQLGERLGGISKQAVSKMEQCRDIDDARLLEIANALEVTFEGLKNFDEDRVLYNAINFYENGGVTVNSLNANAEAFHEQRN